MFSFFKYQHLIYAGAIPFVLATLALAIGLETLGPLGATERLLNSYALTIVSFMSGTTWAHTLQNKDKLGHARLLLLMSNVVVLLCWFSFLFGVLTLLIPAICFILLLGVDLFLYQIKLIDKAYFTPRVYVTAIVVVSLFFSWAIKG